MPSRIPAILVRAAAFCLAAACALIPQGWSAANVVPGSIAESCTVSVPVYVVGAMRGTGLENG